MPVLALVALLLVTPEGGSEAMSLADDPGCELWSVVPGEPGEPSPAPMALWCLEPDDPRCRLEALPPAQATLTRVTTTGKVIPSRPRVSLAPPFLFVTSSDDADGERRGFGRRLERPPIA